MLHKNILPQDCHVPYSWQYANAAARTGATGFVAGDLGRMAWQTDNNSFWVLSATTPTWVAVGGTDLAQGNAAATAIYSQVNFGGF